MAKYHELSALTVSCLLAASSALSAASQEPSVRGNQSQRQAGGPTLLAFDALVNTVVYVTPAKDEEGGEEGGADAATEDVGVLSDFVIDALAQRLTFAVVHTVEGPRAMPMGEMAWDRAKHGWHLTGGKAALARARTFEASRLDELHEERNDGSERSGSGGDGKDAKEGKGMADESGRLAARGEGVRSGAPGAGARAPSGRYLLATAAARRDVMADDGRFAPASGLVVEVRTGVPAFLRLSASGGDVAIPWAALGQRKPTAPGDREAFAVTMTKARLETVPRLNQDAASTLDNRAFRDKLYEFFGVVTPVFEEPLGVSRG